MARCVLSGLIDRASLPPLLSRIAESCAAGALVSIGCRACLEDLRLRR